MRLLIALLLLPIAFAQLMDTLEEGASHTYNLGSNSYNVYVLIIDDNSNAVKFRINDQNTPLMREGMTYILPEGAVIEVREVLPNEAGDVTQDLVEFIITYCGDNVCNPAAEGCGVCQQDCTCAANEFCENNICAKIRCGDDVCSNGESCIEDTCCNGKIVDLTSNENCGECDIQCKSTEKCAQGICKGFCGNGICEEQESCRKDCGYCGDKICQSHEKNCADCQKPVLLVKPLPPKPKDECNKAEDCVDKNPCTKDTCEGIPKKCQHGKQLGCVLGIECKTYDLIAFINGASSFCNKDNLWVQQKSEGSICTKSMECTSFSCLNGKCYVKRTVVQKVGKWFKLFLT